MLVEKLLGLSETSVELATKHHQQLMVAPVGPAGAADSIGFVVAGSAMSFGAAATVAERDPAPRFGSLQLGGAVGHWRRCTATGRKLRVARPVAAFDFACSALARASRPHGGGCCIFRRSTGTLGKIARDIRRIANRGSGMVEPAGEGGAVRRPCRTNGTRDVLGGVGGNGARAGIGRHDALRLCRRSCSGGWGLASRMGEFAADCARGGGGARHLAETMPELR